MKKGFTALFLAVSIILTAFPAQAAAYSRITRRIAPAPATLQRTGLATANTAAAQPANTMADTLLMLLNQERAKYGLPRLQSDTELAALAQTKSRDMVTNRYFSHVSPTLGSPERMLQSSRIAYKLFAENIAQGSDAHQIHAMWMNSPGHRANILNQSFTHVGIGTATGASGSTSATQLFVAR